MRPTSDLSKLHEAVQYRLVRLRRLFSTAQNLDPRKSQLLSYCVIELDNLLMSAVRVFAISSLRGARTSSGQRISTSIPFSSLEQISAYFLSVANSAKYSRMSNPVAVSRKDEPTIRDPRTTEQILSRCGASNLPSFQNALAWNFSVFMDVGTTRNFYAHRNDDTWRKVRTRAGGMGILNISHPDQLLLSRIPTRSLTIFEDWLDETELFFEEATK